MDSVKYVVDERDKVEDLKPAARPFKVEAELRVALAAISIRPPLSSASTSAEEAAAAAPGHSRGNHRTEALCRIPSNVLGPADQPRGRGWPKASKSRPRITFGLSTPPEQGAKLKAEEKLAKMSPSKQV